MASTPPAEAVPRRWGEGEEGPTTLAYACVVAIEFDEDPEVAPVTVNDEGGCGEGLRTAVDSIRKVARPEVLERYANPMGVAESIRTIRHLERAKTLEGNTPPTSEIGRAHV